MKKNRKPVQYWGKYDEGIQGRNEMSKDDLPWEMAAYIAKPQERKTQMPVILSYWPEVKFYNGLPRREYIEGRFIPEQEARELWEMKKKWNDMDLDNYVELCNENAALKEKLRDARHDFKMERIAKEAAEAKAEEKK